MSTGLNCDFVKITEESKPDKWYYILEHGNAPKMTWDWHEYATAYGPFSSEDEAYKHLHDNHANPGGSCAFSLPKAELEKDKVLKNLLAKANKKNPYFGWRN
jgi:hypothetical protein